MRDHLVIPDNQVKPGVDISYVKPLAQLIMKRKPEVIVLLGDVGDFPSLSSYDRHKLQFEGRRYKEDLKSLHKFLDELTKPMRVFNKRQAATKHAQYKPEMHVLIGNHELRIERMAENNPELAEFMGIADCKFEHYGFTTHRFLSILTLDGVHYSHFFPKNARGEVMQSKFGAPSARIQGVRQHASCTAGHSPGLDYDCTQNTADGRRIHSLIAGSCYLHDEEYKTPQGNGNWRGVIYKHNVANGEYDPEFISLERLMK